MIEDFIPHDHPISRDELREIMGKPDREVRKLISQARERGIPILSSSRSKGYWISDDPDEVEHFRNELYHRAMNLLKIYWAMQKIPYEENLELTD